MNTTGLVLLPVIVAAAYQGVAAQVLSTEVIAAKAVPATVTILTFGADNDTLGFGSGFLVKPNGVIVTNHHVMVGASRASVFLSTGERYDWVEGVASDESRDLAILKIPGYGLPVLTPSSILPPVGGKLVAVGSPLGLSHTVSVGIVSAIRLMDGHQLLQMSVPISPGSSGGPVLNARGNVVAVTSKYLKDGQNLNFAVPIGYAMGLVEAGGTAEPLALRFGASKAAAAGTITSARAQAAVNEDLPAQIRSPRTTVAGTYLVYEQAFVQRLGEPESDPFERIGLLIVGGNDIGFYVSKKAETDNASVNVYSVLGTNATPDGRVVVELAGMAFSGYQTDDGLHLKATSAPTPNRAGIRFRLDATLHSTDLARRDGLYNLTARTKYRSDKYGAGDYADWFGEAAIVVANDSIYVDMYLRNAEGGSTATYLAGPIGAEGEFELKNSSKTLSGRLSSSRLEAEWVDRRDGAQFEGRLDGRRQ